MFKKKESPLCLNPKPSGRLKRIIVVVRMLALAACLSNALPITVKGFLFAMTYVCFAELVKRLKNGHYAIKYSDASGWEFSTCKGCFEDVRILPSTVVTKYALFLHIESRQKNPLNNTALKGTNKKTALILADTLSDDEYRCLIVKLITTAIKQEQTNGSVDRINPLK
ncbi:MAG: hypothetical protein Q8N96_10825 [Methylovulum sp.]|nr:hypothetical protein [Methylovulum sp.]